MIRFKRVYLLQVLQVTAIKASYKKSIPDVSITARVVIAGKKEKIFRRVLNSRQNRSDLELSSITQPVLPDDYKVVKSALLWFMTDTPDLISPRRFSALRSFLGFFSGFPRLDARNTRSAFRGPAVCSREVAGIDYQSLSNFPWRSWNSRRIRGRNGSH